MRVGSKHNQRTNECERIRFSKADTYSDGTNTANQPRIKTTTPSSEANKAHQAESASTHITDQSNYKPMHHIKQLNPMM